MIRPGSDTWRFAPALLVMGALSGTAAHIARADVLPSLEKLAFEETATPAAAGSAEPSLTVGDGTAWLTWVETPASGAPSLRFSRWEGSAWSGAKTIVSDAALFTNWADTPGLLVLADGTLAAAYMKKAGGEGFAYDVFVSTSSDGGATWSQPLKPHRDGTATEHGFVSLAPDPVEGFWAIWLDGRDYATKGKSSPETQLRGALWREGKFGAEVVLDTRACDCCRTAAVRTLEGMAVAYRDRSEDEIRDISVVRYERRVWEKPFTIRNDGWHIQGCPVSGPVLASTDRYLAMAWFTNAGDQPQVYAALSDSSSFGLSRVVRVDEGKPLGRVDVDWLPDETALVTWVEQTEGGPDLLMRRFSLDGKSLDRLVLAKTGVDRESGLPRMVVQGVNIWVAWTDGAEQATQVKVGRLDLTKME